ncbi:MAG: NAD(P)H-dependent oxidoreductase [Pseudorhodoplanes sp.]|jgi:NAD(P)H-dependent FMN reductase|nr:NAD(P)H-dependent oxidoreductase [Pseudorhodoplanes sp.]
MPIPRILVFAGSIRTGSFNARLAANAAKQLALLEAEVTHISLADYPMPLYDADLEARSGQPENAIKLKQLFMAHGGIFIASPEYNASITPLLKNTLDWISRVREGRESPLAAYKDRVFALGGASNGNYGAMRSLLALRQVLEIGCGALVIPDQIAVPRAADAYDENDNLKDEQTMNRLKGVLQRLIDVTRQLA